MLYVVFDTRVWLVSYPIHQLNCLRIRLLCLLRISNIGNKSEPSQQQLVRSSRCLKIKPLCVYDKNVIVHNNTVRPRSVGPLINLFYLNYTIYMHL